MGFSSFQKMVIPPDRKHLAIWGAGGYICVTVREVPSSFRCSSTLSKVLSVSRLSVKRDFLDSWREQGGFLFLSCSIAKGVVHDEYLEY